jgi:hypothetical protein
MVIIEPSNVFWSSYVLFSFLFISYKYMWCSVLHAARGSVVG